MAEVIVCGRCGAPSWAGAPFCHACGQSLTPDAQPADPPAQPPAPAPSAAVPPATQPFYGVPGPYAAPPAGYDAAPPPAYQAAGQSTAGTARPFGTVLLVATEIVIGIIGLLVAIDLLQWVNYGINYEDTGEIPLDLVMGLAYLATSVMVFEVARGLWSNWAWAWGRACLLSVALLGLILVSVIPWGIDTLDVIGVAAHLSVLAYLNQNSTRARFGRPPSTFLQFSA